MTFNFYPILVLLSALVLGIAHSVEYEGNCGELMSPGECPGIKCTTCEYLDGMCTCRRCPEWNPAASMGERRFFYCLYNKKLFCGLEICNKTTTTAKTTATTAARQPATADYSVNQPLPVADTDILDNNQSTSLKMVVIVVSAVLGIILLVILVVVGYYLTHVIHKKSARLSDPEEMSLPEGVGVCTACDLIVRGTGTSPIGRYCECV